MKSTLGSGAQVQPRRPAGLQGGQGSRSGRALSAGVDGNHREGGAGKVTRPYLHSRRIVLSPCVLSGFRELYTQKG